MEFDIKPSKAIFFVLLALSLFTMIVPIVQYASYYSKYMQSTTKGQSTIFAQVILSTLNKEMDSLWTEQEVYDFVQSLSRFNFASVNIGNPQKEDVYLPSGKTINVQVINVSLGGIMTMNDTISLIRAVESTRKLTYMQPVHANNLQDFKQFNFKFYLGENIPKPQDRPLTYNYNTYGLVAMYKNPDDAKGVNKIKIPVWYANRLWLGIFDEGKETSVTLYSR